MNGKKELLANIIGVLRANKILAKTRSLVVEDIRIIAYHRICDEDPINDKELVSANCEEFEKQIIHIKENYSAISFKQLIEYQEEGIKLPPKPIIITFDDGFADNYLNAFPILSKHSVPATFFISTDYIGKNETFWFNQLSRLIKLNPNTIFELAGKSFSISSNTHEQEELLSQLLALLKSKPNKSRLALLTELSGKLDQVTECDQLALPMSWKNVVEMSESVIEIGSHTATHPILSQLTEEELRYEIYESKQVIERKLGKIIHTISYPEGMEYAYNEQVVTMVMDAGYQIGCSYIPGTNKLRTLENFQLRRLHIERYVNFNLFCSMLALPELFA